MSARRVTSQDVANHAGVSRTTVSLVLNDVQGIQISDETRQRVFDAARELGYVPEAAAQALARRRVKIIGLILTRTPHHLASDAFLTQILDGLIEVVRQHGMRLLIDIVDPQRQQEAYLELVRAKHIDGVILSGPRFDDKALQTLEEDSFPMVLMGQLPGSSICSVDVDNRAAARMAVAHLIKLGHSRIACITNAQPIYTAASDRLEGYNDALGEANIPYDKDLVRYGDFDLQSGYVQMNSLLDSGSPFTAAFVASDVVLLGAETALRERGLKVPENIALVGFDDIPLSYYTEPPITTIHLPAKDLARRASEMLIQLLKGDQPAQRQIIMDTHLVVRESCGMRKRQSPN